MVLAQERDPSLLSSVTVSQCETTVAALVLGLRHDVEQTRLNHGDWIHVAIAVPTAISAQAKHLFGSEAWSS
jgi:hypothetical protein